MKVDGSPKREMDRHGAKDFISRAKDRSHVVTFERAHGWDAHKRIIHPSRYEARALLQGAESFATLAREAAAIGNDIIRDANSLGDEIDAALDKIRQLQVEFTEA